ncbi:MAG: pentapeptide repeat-containing protein [archaeon]|nr:pentapeptide repeat-containing protein [archaeon]
MVSEMYCDSDYLEGMEMVDDDLNDCEFDGCTFTGCRFENCRFSNCSFNECTFDSCRFVSNGFNGCRMRDNGFKDCSFVGMNFSAVRSGPLPPLEYAVDCVMRYCIFENIPMAKVSLKGTEFVGSSFDGCDLKGANIGGCTFEGTAFGNCVLENADFRGSTGYIIDVRDCKVKGARFSYPEALHLLDPFGIRLE